MLRPLPLLLLAALALVLAGCTSGTTPPEPTPRAAAPPTGGATPTTEATHTAASTATEATTAPAPRLTPEGAVVVDLSIERLAGWLGTSRDVLSLDHIVRTEWPDTCLGFGRPGQQCDQATLPGYLVRIFLGGEWSYQLRTNLDGLQIVWATDWIVEGTFSSVDQRLGLLTISGDFPGALDARVQQYRLYPGSETSVVASLRYGDPVLVAGDGRPSSDVPLLIWIERDPERERPPADDPERVAGAARLALSVMLESGGLEVSSIEAVEWLDTCLEVPRPSMHCTAVSFPGYRVRLENESGAAYEIRTNAEGSRFV
jgi:hypothetical protein